MRVLFIVDGLIPSPGGAEKQALALAAAMMKQDPSVVVEILAPQLQRCQSLSEVYRGVKITRLRYIKLRPIASFFLGFATWRYLRVNAHRFDVIHVHMLKVMAAVVGLMSPALTAFTVGKIAGDTELSGGVLDAQRWRLDVLFYRWGLRRLHGIQVMSRHIEQSLRQQRFSPERFLFIPNGVSLRPVASVSEHAGVTLGFTGRLVAVKGLEYLLEAFAQVYQKHPECRLLLVGDGPDRASLQAQAEALNIASAVTFVGYVSDTLAYLRQMDIYVQPSLREGLPNALIEAMSQGVSAIATRISGNEDVIEHGTNGLLVPPAEAGPLAEAIGQLINDPRLRERLAQQGVQAVRQTYDMERVVETWLSQYRAARGRRLAAATG